MLHRVRAPKSGYITHIDAEKCGVAAAMLGAGRQKKGDPIDYAAGITFTRELGEQVEESFEFARFYTAERGPDPRGGASLPGGGDHLGGASPGDAQTHLWPGQC